VSAKADLDREVERVLLRLWSNLQGMLVAGGLILTWQPSEPTAGRRSLATDRCIRLTTRISINEVENRVFLEGHVLDGVLIHPAQTEPLPATAETGITDEATTDASISPVPTDPEFIDLRKEPPRLPRYRSKDRGGPLRLATLEEMDDCIGNIAELDGGQTNRSKIRDWGRHWLRTFKSADTTQDVLVARFNDPEHDGRRRPGGNPRNAG
jgi:hypothetical protein